MKITTPKRTIEVTLPRLTLRNEHQIRQWYDKLQAIAREHIVYNDVLVRFLAEARKRDYDLSHLISSNGALTEYAEQLSADELRDALLDTIAGDVELIKLLINTPTYPRTRQAFETAIDFLRNVCNVEIDDEELLDVSFDEVAVIIEEFFRTMR